MGQVLSAAGLADEKGEENAPGFCTGSRSQQVTPAKGKDAEIISKKMSVWSQKNVLVVKLCEYSATDHCDGIEHLCEKQGAVAFINYLTSDGFAPLHFAAQNGSRRAAEALVEHGADLHLKAEDGRDAMQIAVEHGHAEFAEYLRQQIELQQTASKRRSGHRGTPRTAPGRPDTGSSYSSRVSWGESGSRVNFESDADAKKLSPLSLGYSPRGPQVSPPATPFRKAGTSPVLLHPAADDRLFA